MFAVLLSDQIGMHAQTTGQTPPITVNIHVLNVAICLSDHAEAETLSKHACRPYTSALLALLLTGTYIVFYVHANTLAVFEAEHGGAHINVVCQQPHDCLHKCLCSGVERGHGQTGQGHPA